MEIGHIAHTVPGRLRLKVPARQGDAGYFQQLGEQLLTLGEIDRVTVNPATGSVLLHHRWPSAEAFAAACEEHGLLDFVEPSIEPLWRQAQTYVDALDRRLSAATRGDLGMRSALLLALVAMGLRQAARGEVMAPAVTLFWYALQLLQVPGELPVADDAR